MVGRWDPDSRELTPTPVEQEKIRKILEDDKLVPPSKVRKLESTLGVALGGSDPFAFENALDHHPIEQLERAYGIADTAARFANELQSREDISDHASRRLRILVVELRRRRGYLGSMIRLRVSEQQAEELTRALEAKVEDPQARKELSELVEELTSQQQDLSRQLQSREDDDARELRKQELAERKWKMRKSLLDREPAAVLIGGLLLSLLTVTFLIGMFIHTPPPELLANAFLLILGFFFGQTTSGRGKPAAEE